MTRPDVVNPTFDQAHRPDDRIAIDQMAKCNTFLADLTDWARDHETIQ